jgi:hypothetical protein
MNNIIKIQTRKLQTILPSERDKLTTTCLQEYFCNISRDQLRTCSTKVIATPQTCSNERDMKNYVILHTIHAINLHCIGCTTQRKPTFWGSSYKMEAKEWTRHPCMSCSYLARGCWGLDSISPKHWTQTDWQQNLESTENRSSTVVLQRCKPIGRL